MVSARSEAWLLASAAIAGAAIFWADVAAPEGMGAAAGYALPVLLALWSRRPGAAIGLAAISSIGIVTAGILALGDSPAGAVVAGRALALAATWAIAVVVSRHVELRRAGELRAREGGEIVKELADFKDALDKWSILAITDRRGIILSVNDKFCEISKYSREELIGKDHRVINSGHHPKEFFRGLWSTIGSGAVWRGEIRNRAKDGSYYWVDTTIVPFLDESGKPFQYVAIRNDITQRTLAQQKLLEQGSLARLGEMAAVVAHEVKNPLAGISGALQVLGSRMAADAPERPIVEEMIARLGALDDMVQDLLLFARPRAPRLAEVHVAPLLRETANLIAQDPVLRSAEIVVQGDDATILADASMLSQVFQNLVINAAQAMGGQGRVLVTIAPTPGACSVSVADSGPGIPADARERIFEPFFTTKHRGTGLGLAVARRAVEAHGGTIVATETPGGGATMTVTLPARGVTSA